MRLKTYALFVLFSVIALWGCNSNEKYADVDGKTPVISLSAAHIKSEPGREVTFLATISDNDGIQSINLNNSNFYLDKTIEPSRDTLTHSYQLAYKYTLADSLSGSSYPVVLTVTDIGGRQTTATYQVTMDGDFIAPSFTSAPDTALTVLIKDQTKLNLKFTVSDDKALDSVTVSIPEINYSNTITTGFTSGTTLSFSESIQLPSTAATYSLKLRAVDKSGLESTTSSKITVSAMPDFAKMYLTDVDNESQLTSDIFGVPMLIERTAAYTYRARYYSEAAGTKIRFIPQKTSFDPICFGKDPDNSALLTDDPSVSEAIVLPTVGYYVITFNVQSGEYSVNTYTPTDTPVAIGSTMYLNGSNDTDGTIPLQIGLIGTGIPNAGTWSPQNPLILTQSSDNKYLLSVEMSLTAGNTIGFIIGPKHTWGWWPEPFWRWDRSDDPEANVSNGGENPGSWTIKTTGTYIFKFDTHLKRSKLYLKN